MCIGGVYLTGKYGNLGYLARAQQADLLFVVFTLGVVFRLPRKFDGKNYTIGSVRFSARNSASARPRATEGILPRSLLGSRQEEGDSEDRDKFVSAAIVETRTLEGNGTWDKVPMSDAKARIIPGRWTFRPKRTPDCVIYCHKAHYCVRGDLQETQDDTYAPVVAFSTIRLFLAFALSFNGVSVHGER